ncbi:MAG: DUF5916 domain-containing protein [Gemmatimonadota bacterium]
MRFARIDISVAAALFMTAASFFAGPLAGQTGSDPRFDHSSAPHATAVRTAESIQIDGRPDEAAWLSAPMISEFTQVEPNEWAPVSERTEMRILYDDYNIYIAGWLYDDGELTTRLGRRDSTWPDTDSFIVFLDTYHDHRTAYRFTVNPSGVKRDEIITIGGSSNPGRGGPSGTGFGDTSWDPVWDLATSVTDEGWFVEMRIPFGQLGYAPGDVQHWGLQADRRIGRNAEHASWSFTPVLERATVSRFGHLEGISGIRRAGRLELLPFAAGRAEFREIPQSSDVDFTNPFRSGNDYFSEVGADLKYRLSSNLTLNATINPDFGQVEMDPADLNLSAFETRLNERRPFFVEGDEIFSFGQRGGMNTNILYTRRIGRSPQISLPGDAVYADSPGATTILGAVKMTGKTEGGWSLGVLDAVTNRESATFIDELGSRDRSVVEPWTNYFAARARRDINQGRTAFGIIGTAVNRDLEDEPGLVNRLHGHAFTGGLDFRHDLPGRTWSFSGEFTPSYVTGDAAAILRTQRTSARYFQRPDADHLELDPDATSLFGYGAKIDIAKESGAWRGGTTFTALSPSLEVNDLGFQTNADRIDLNTNVGFDRATPGSIFRRWNIGGGPSATWNYGGDLTSAEVGIGGGGQLLNYHSIGGRISRNLPSWNDRLTRGGPLTRSPGSYFGNVNFNSDNRMTWSFRFGTGGMRNDDGGWRINLNGGVTGKPTEAIEVRVNPSFSRSHNVAQYVTSVSDSYASDTFGRRYVFGSLDQTTLSLDTRVNVTFTPRLTLEMFAEPFISSGDYGPLKQLAAPRSFDFLEYGTQIGESELGSDGRYSIDPDGAGPASTFQISNQNFNYHSLLGNAVLRWEWSPGSTLFFVWQQSRTERLTSLATADARSAGDFDFEKDARALLGIRPENIFMVKVNYWLNP